MSRQDNKRHQKKRHHNRQWKTTHRNDEFMTFKQLRKQLQHIMNAVLSISFIFIALQAKISQSGRIQSRDSKRRGLANQFAVTLKASLWSDKNMN